MPKLKNSKVNGIVTQNKDKVLSYLKVLGFPSELAQRETAKWQGVVETISYKTYGNQPPIPYLTVVLLDKDIMTRPLPGMFEFYPRPTYLAFTNGDYWDWYHNDLNNLNSLGEPPPPPCLPLGGKKLLPIQDKRTFKQMLQSMNVALRDSRGGGIVERFDVISKILFLKVFDEREVEQGMKTSYDFHIGINDTLHSVSNRIKALWLRACSQSKNLFKENPPALTQDDAGLFRIVEKLQTTHLLSTTGDIKGLAYEEILKNTFEKDENQQFFTPPEIVEFMVSMTVPKADELICDPACGTGGFLVEVFKHIGNSNHLIGVDVDERISTVAQMNLIMHAANKALVYHVPGTGSLSPADEVSSELTLNSFDLILTNPPFGSDLTDINALRTFKTGQGRTSRRRSILFTERCLNLLRPGGRMAIVLDDSVLNLPTNSDIRDLICSQAIIDAVISLPDVTFMPYSTAKSSILFLRKKGVQLTQGPIFMADIDNVGRKPNGDPLYADERDKDGKRILQNDLPAIISVYNKFKIYGIAEHPSCFIISPTVLDDRLDIPYYHPKRFAAEQEIERSCWPTLPLSELVTPRSEMINPSTEFGDSPIRWIGLGDIEEGTGVYDIKIVPGDKIKSNAAMFRGGDILFSRLRPNLRKVVFIENEDEGGVCSSEIIVLCKHDKLTSRSSRRRKREEAIPSSIEIDFEYLTFMLRSDLVYGQLLYKVTGVGRPRVSSETILSVKIPVPPIEEQRRLVSSLRRAYEEATSARKTALLYMNKAKEVVENTYDQIIAEMMAKKEQT